MRIISKFQILALIFLAAGPLANATANHGPPLSIIIDPGHGGVDHGATRGEIKESQICLHISQYLVAMLKKNPQFKVSLTRASDEQMSLGDRVELSKINKADLFLSIHANASEDPKAFGMELYFQNQMAPDEESLFLANAENQNALSSKKLDKLTSQNDVDNIVDDLKRNQRISQSFDLSESLFDSLPRAAFGRIKNHALRQAPFYVISQTNIPAVLVEVGYISSDVDKVKLASPEYQKKLAGYLYEGLLKHKEILDKERIKSLE